MSYLVPSLLQVFRHRAPTIAGAPKLLSRSAGSRLSRQAHVITSGRRVTSGVAIVRGDNKLNKLNQSLLSSSPPPSHFFDPPTHPQY